VFDDVRKRLGELLESLHRRTESGAEFTQASGEFALGEGDALVELDVEALMKSRVVGEKFREAVGELLACDFAGHALTNDTGIRQENGRVDG